MQNKFFKFIQTNEDINLNKSLSLKTIKNAN
jgi:hypothetical protein